MDTSQKPSDQSHNPEARLRQLTVSLEQSEQKIKELLASNQELENKLAETNKNSWNGTWEMDLKTQQVSWSEGIYHILGIRKNINPDMKLYKEMIDDVSVEKLDGAVRKVFITGEDYSFEHTLVTEKNKKLIIKTDLKLIKDENNKPAKLLGIIQDITSEKNARQELEKLSLIASKTSNAVVIMNTDTQIEWINDGFIRMTGYRFDEIQNKEFNLLFTDKDCDVCSKEALEKELTMNHSYEKEIQINTKHGKTLCTVFNITPILNYTLEPVNYIAIITNITKRKEAEEKLFQANKEITDSINYAKRIQSAIIPSVDEIKKYFPDSFVLFKPKDIVSGDFYWFGKIGDKVIIASADCTGHGVPGAFMSMIGNSLLNEIIIGKGITEADTILIELRKSIIKTLGQTGKEDEARDGMDIALCVIAPLNPPGGGTLPPLYPTGMGKGGKVPPPGGFRGAGVGGLLEFSGANNPLYIVRKGIANLNITNTGNIEYYGEDLVALKPDKQSIGYEQGKGGNFTKHQIQLQKGDVIYIFSDGYADQLGGDHCKKFGYNRFRQLLTDISDKNMEEQKQILDKNIEAWKDHIDPYNNKPLEQMDDILVMGMRIGQ
ncbi:MAG: PAS domain S-box protein [Cytophagales bacterium]|nr:PAS domain S-box protein [Cytophagales bacterium]